MSASGMLTALRYVSESVLGTASGNIFKALRFTDTSLNLKKATFESNEIRSDRQRADLRHGMKSADGDISVELGLTTFDDLLEAAISGNWSAITSGAQNMSADSGTNSVTEAGGSFDTLGFEPGDTVVLSGFTQAGNNASGRLTAVTATTLTFDPASLTITTEVAAAGKTVALVGKKVKGGTAFKSFSFERAFTDVNEFFLFQGCVIDSLKVTIKPEQIVTAALSIVGQGKVTVSGATNAVGGITAAAVNPPLDSFVGVLNEGGTSLAVVTSLEFELKNNRQGQGVIGKDYSPEIFEGQQQITGTITAFFKDSTLLTKFINETETSLDVTLTDANGTDFHHIHMPRIKYTGGALDNPKTGPVILTLPFTALYNAGTGTSISYQRSNP